MSQRFVGDDGRVPKWLTFLEDGKPRIKPDKCGAALVLLAALSANTDEFAAQVDPILRERDAAPLLGGLISLGTGLARIVWGENAGLAGDQLALAWGFKEETNDD